MPCYLPVIQYAHDRELRRTLYHAYATRASDQGDTSLDNSPLIEEALSLRAEESQLLGFQHFADLRLQTRMADSAEEVMDFLRQLAKRAKPFAERDLTELKAFAKSELGLTELHPWDVPYASERLREARYAYSEDEVKQYFTEPRVLSGLFEVVETLFGVKLVPYTLNGWHEDVRAATVLNHSGEILGYLILDLYARSGKQGGAWVDSERNRRKRLSTVQTPVIYLTCNFARPQGDRPALLTHDDVITLFHESGHALHALLSEVDEPGVSAFAAVEWDAIELPSQFMENFCWEWQVLQRLTAHIDSNEPLPKDLYDRMKAARNFQSGMQTVRQIEFSLFDIQLHNRRQGLSIAEVLTQLDQVREEVAVIRPPGWHRFPHSFSHLFAGGYGAGYYSYKWAEVLSADAFEAFEEAAARSAVSAHQASESLGTLDPETGMKFRREVLAVGGTRPAAESFSAFRGRPPKMDALLRHSGMLEESMQ
jgi:oligopeptidase A